MRIPLADVIAHRHLLSPREAATLTLAVGREWDRKQARCGGRPLPDVTHIELSKGGVISFAESAAETPATGVTTLSGLLGQLLGLDDQHASHQPIPGGLPITASREDGFRSALLQFADEDPGVLARLFTRIVRPRPNRTGGGRDVHVGRRATVVLVAAAVVLLLSTTSFLIGAMHTPMPVPQKAVTQVRTPMQLVRPSADASTRAIAPARKATRPVRSAPAPRPVRAQERKSPDNHVPTTFAGGSRAITWSQTIR